MWSWGGARKLGGIERNHRKGYISTANAVGIYEDEEGNAMRVA
jgi:hypothetical protein